MKTIKRYWHYLMCTVSRKYRLTHVQHVDELPPWTQRRMRRECEEMDGRGWNSSEDMMRDLLQEIDAEIRILRLERLGSHAELFG